MSVPGMSKAEARRLLQLQAMLDAIETMQQARRAASDLAQRLIALGVEPRQARMAAEKAQRNGCGLCMAKNRRGLPCIALGDGAGGRNPAAREPQPTAQPVDNPVDNCPV